MSEREDDGLYCAPIPVIRATYYTDPACPWSWASEPERRRMQAELGEGVQVTFVMAGLARRFERPQEALAEWLEAAAAAGMPVDPRLWIEAPPASSYPASLAVKAAAEQNLDAAYLRRAREGFAAQRRKLDNPSALTELARTLPGLDVARFTLALESNAVIEAFAADLEQARMTAAELGVKRLTLPTVEFHGAAQRPQRVVGLPAPGAYVDAARLAGAPPASAPRPGVEDVLRRFGPMATAEIAAACDLPGPRAPAELWHLASQWRARPEPVLASELWHAV